MTAVAPDNWHVANQRYLTAALDHIRAALERHTTQADHTDAAAEPIDVTWEKLQAAAKTMPAPSTIETLAASFGLSDFERDLLLLCAGVEFDAGFAPLCAEAQGDPQRTYPTFRLALAALPEPHWSAIGPAGPLRRWRLLEIGPGNTLTASPLRIDERVLHYLADVQQLDERLIGMVEPVAAPEGLIASHLTLAERIARCWAQASNVGGLPAIQLIGGERADQQTIAAAACAMTGLRLWMLPASMLPTTASEIDQLARLWDREAVLADAALLIACADLEATDALRSQAVDRLIARIGGPLLIVGDQRRVCQHPVITLDVPRPTTDEQRAIWHHVLGNASAVLNGHVEALAAQFSLSASAIRAASSEVLSLVGDESLEREDMQSADLDALAAHLWEASRAQARPRLDELAQPIEPSASWDDLVLPEPQQQVLGEIALHVRQRARVYEQWGFAGKRLRGLGISALFAGASGTGKTMAAEVLAHELRLDLYRIDLSAVVSKYIGETEKNLRRVFDAAEAGGAILLFDEADALFGKRSEVKDSHDRYANVEVSYLLQRMETYRGLAILTTNLQNALDNAFLRRIRFVVQFPFPDAAQRAEIWRRIFPPDTPTQGLDAAKLARLSMAGGNIRNIALNAAFLAADENAPVRMDHLLRSARGEYAKLEKPLTAGEIKDWA